MTTAATTNAAAEDVTVPERYIAETLDFETRASEGLSVERVGMGIRRARLPHRGGRALARVVRPSLMLLNLMPTAVPTR